MKIAQADVSLSSRHQLERQSSVRESLQLVRNGAQGQEVTTLARASGEADRVSLSARAQALAARVETRDADLVHFFDRNSKSARPEPSSVAARPEAADFRPAGVRAQAAEPEGPQAAPLDGRLLVIKTIIERLSGRRLEVFDPASLKAAPQAAPDVGSTTPEAEADPSPVRADENFGMRYERVERLEEHELTRFGAEARIRTADGRELAVALDLELSRHLVTQDSVFLEAGARLRDPLVVNLGQPSVTLGSERIDFDLNADGRRESLPLVAGGSGLLALDRNGNGQVDDGRELFGALSGNGFADLVPLDEDGNGFIDAGDRAFDELRIWVRREGQDQLLSLEEAEVGALHLGFAETPFDLRSPEAELLGRVRSSGFFLRQDGSAGSLQQVDLVV